MTIDDVVGTALGVLRMTEAEFEAMTPYRFALALRLYNKVKEEEQRERWELARVMVTTYANTYAKHPKKPEQLWPLPWDKEKKDNNNRPLLSAEDMEDIARKIWQKD